MRPCDPTPPSVRVWQVDLSSEGPTGPSPYLVDIRTGDAEKVGTLHLCHPTPNEALHYGPIQRRKSFNNLYDGIPAGLNHRIYSRSWGRSAF